MKKTFTIFGLLLLINTLWMGCEPVNRFAYSSGSYIYIDSTASACDVDSCVINFPWLNDMIETTLADSRQSKLAFRISLYVDMYVYTDSVQSQRTYFEIRQDDGVQTKLYDCDGNVSTDILRDGYGNIIYDELVSITHIVDISMWRDPNI